MKKTIKIISIFLILVFALEIVVQAGFGVNDIASNNANTTMSDPEKKVVSIGNKILSIIRLLGTVLSVIMLMIIGIKYMLGSVEEKSQYKQTLIPYVIGALLLFAASVIPQIIYEFLSGKK